MSALAELIIDLTQRGFEVSFIPFLNDKKVLVRAEERSPGTSIVERFVDALDIETQRGDFLAETLRRIRTEIEVGPPNRCEECDAELHGDCYLVEDDTVILCPACVGRRN